MRKRGDEIIMNILDFVGVAEAFAVHSKNPKRRIGAIILRPDLTFVSAGWNDLARRVAHSAERYEQPLKDFYCVHAELNAILNAARIGVSTDRCHMLVTGLAPCANCANAIVQAGIRQIWFPDPSNELTRWQESFSHSFNILEEGGVNYDTYKP